MSGSQRSVGKFCSVETDTLLTLANVDASDLGNGAQIYVVSNNRSYRFVLGSVFPTKSPVTVAAADASGTWFQENAIGDQSFFIEQISSAGDFSGTINTWHAMPTGVTRYAQDSARACWAVNVSNGIVTYSGPTATFLVQARFSMVLNDVITTYEFDLSRNGAALDTTLSFPTSSKAGSVLEPEPQLSRPLFCAHLSTPIVMVSGQTLQHILRDTSTTALYEMDLYQASFTLLP